MMGLTYGGGVGVLSTMGGTFNNLALSTAVANGGTATGIDTTTGGLNSNAGNNGATAYGAYANAADENTTAIGFRAVARFKGSVAIGFQAQAIADPTVAIGDNALASGNDAVALGAAAQATSNNSVALGANARATATRSVALGDSSVADQPNTVSVGSPGNERRITNVAAGIAPTDAVNVSQLRDAINQTQEVARLAYTGTAMSMAMAGITWPMMEGGDKAVGVGLGTYRGYSAVSLGFKSFSGSGDTSWGVGFSTNGQAWAGQMGFALKWK